MNIYIALVPQKKFKLAYPSLTLEEVYATILYYLHNQKAVNQYLADCLEWGHQQRKKQAQNPPPAAARLQKIKAERDAKNVSTY